MHMKKDNQEFKERFENSGDDETRSQLRAYIEGLRQTSNVPEMTLEEIEEEIGQARLERKQRQG